MKRRFMFPSLIITLIVVIGGAVVWWTMSQKPVTPITATTVTLESSLPSGWKEMSVQDLQVSFGMPQDWVYFRGATADPLNGDVFSIGTKNDQTSLGGDVVVVQRTASSSTMGTYCPTTTCTAESFVSLEKSSNKKTTVSDHVGVVTKGTLWLRIGNYNWFIVSPETESNRAIFNIFLTTLQLPQ